MTEEEENKKKEKDAEFEMKVIAYGTLAIYVMLILHVIFK